MTISYLNFAVRPQHFCPNFPPVLQTQKSVRLSSLYLLHFPALLISVHPTCMMRLKNDDTRSETRFSSFGETDESI
jgi:hypothetical protein